MFESLQRSSSSIFSRVKGCLTWVWNGIYRTATHPITFYIFHFLKIITFVGLIVWALPWIYVQAEIPRTMRPVNYYDFLNCLLLLYLTYRIEIMTMRPQPPRRRLRKDEIPGLEDEEDRWFSGD